MEEEEPEAMELDEHPVIESEVNVSLNRSGLMRIVSPGEEKQPFNPHPVIRNERNLTEDIKIACAKVAVGAQCSAKYARIAVQVACREIYGHEFYLTAKEQIEKEGGVETSSELPHSSEDWKNFKYVLPSEKTIMGLWCSG